MLHTVVIDAEALTALDQLFTAIGKPLPRSGVVERAHGRAWHAVPIDEASISAVQNLRTANDEPFNDTLRRMLDLPPLRSETHREGALTQAYSNLNPNRPPVSLASVRRTGRM